MANLQAYAWRGRGKSIIMPPPGGDLSRLMSVENIKMNDSGLIVLDSRGPLASISPPGGATLFAAGSTSASRQTAINAAAEGTDFAFAAGTHTSTSSNIPKSGQTFTGHYGAIIDGSGWAQSADPTDACFKSHNADINDVVIRNLTIQNMPWYAVKAYYQTADRWTIDHCDLIDNVYGVGPPNDSVVSHCHILRNTGVPGLAIFNGGNLTCFRSDTVLWNNCEIGWGGTETKLTHCFDVTFRNCWVHHGEQNGVWFDGDSPGSIIEDCVIEDNTIFGIFLEVAQQIITRRNIIRRNGWVAIAIHTTRDCQVYENDIAHSGSGSAISLRFETSRGALGPDEGSDMVTPWDLMNNDLHDNMIVITGSGKAGDLVIERTTPNGEVNNPFTGPAEASYLDNTKDNRWFNNTYDVSNPSSGVYWAWGLLPGAPTYTWAQWQALVFAGTDGQDPGSTIT